jgi:hypothetical protein
MMGEQGVMQEAPFYGFSLERHVPDNHLLSENRRFLDLSELPTHLGPYYSDVGPVRCSSTKSIQSSHSGSTRGGIR